MAEHVDPPYHEQLEWNVIEEPAEGPDNFVERVLEHVRQGKSSTCLGAPGTGKSTGILCKVREDLLARGGLFALPPRMQLHGSYPKQIPFIISWESMQCEGPTQDGFYSMR